MKAAKRSGRSFCVQKHLASPLHDGLRLEHDGLIPSGYGAGVVMYWSRDTGTSEKGFEGVDAAMTEGEMEFTCAGDADDAATRRPEAHRRIDLAP